jgi:hypothetical protein
LLSSSTKLSHGSKNCENKLPWLLENLHSSLSYIMVLVLNSLFLTQGYTLFCITLWAVSPPDPPTMGQGSETLYLLLALYCFACTNNMYCIICFYNVFQPTKRHPPPCPLGGTRVRKHWSAVIYAIITFLMYYIIVMSYVAYMISLS